jgi:anti-sigma B factor antagonist
VSSTLSGISKTVLDGLAVITITGELDLVAASALRRALRPSADAPLPDLLVDLGRVTLIDCAVLGVLVRTSAAVQARDGRLRLRG